MTLRLRKLAVILAVLASAALSAEVAGQPVGTSLELPIETFELDNGLRIVLSENHTSPTVAVAVLYDVGSANEVPGRTGFAHLFEHMMFEGSANVGKGEHFHHVLSNGGRMNGFTTEDVTVYFEILPSDRLELGLWLESDRMMSLNVTAENFENQREVVKEERRLRVDNQPYVPAWLSFMELAYESWAYSHSVIGDMADLDAAELSDVLEFHDRYYRPNNALLVLAGDFDSARARTQVQRYFGEIPAGPSVEGPSYDEPPQINQRQQIFYDELATQPQLLMGWHVPAEPDPTHEALLIVERILAGGEASRLYDRLVRSDGTALSVSSEILGRRGPDMLVLEATSQGAAPEVLRDAITAIIEDLRDSGASAAEVEAARQQLIRDRVFDVESNLRRALNIGFDALFYGDPERINSDLERIRAVTPDDVNAAIRRYLDPDRSDVMLIRALGGGAR